MKRVGKVSLVGAGPGDPMLVTLKALESIRNADVIFYDNLINEKLLDYARNNAEIIYAGKKTGKHSKDESHGAETNTTKKQQNSI